ncbi:hypothetical protein P3T76_001148 [Phytophthora citrophthora]|uniref:Myb/SANT-like domain-containing protein n=1 Tax=Phytophthora citrophthora TaxID=4793 RepID=A0AAD9LRR5_9STRA|nr:hypothetical protein P3T76_001148 [Phytophthora citrophthora]
MSAWQPAMERALLEQFEKARQDPELRTGRGIKARTWSDIASDLNKRYTTLFAVDQIKSKYARLMSDYDIFKEIGGEEGSLTDEDWQKLIDKRPTHASRFRQFKQHGCAHIDICRRIAATKSEDGPVVKAERRSKRSAQSVNDKQEIKKARVEGDNGGWSLLEEKLLLFLCWKAKNDREVFGDEDLKPQGWTDVTEELNKFSTANFNEKEVKDKYVELMQRYSQFKIATGFLGVVESIPKSDMDWERLTRERPGHYAQLEKLKEAGGFPHAEVCSLIKGDTPPNGMDPANTRDYLATGALQIPAPIPIRSQAQSAHAIASAQASLSANALSYLLPATANLVTSMAPSTTNGERSPDAADQPDVAVPVAGVGVGAGAPAVFSQELHDNLNMFLKTATAYLVMLINDHNQEREFKEDMKQAWGHQRAMWDGARERVLLEVFDNTRQQPKLRTDRGLKAKGWDKVAEEVNDRCKSTFNADQLKSKYARLMMDYELFKDVGGERGLSDKEWDKLIVEIPDSAKRLMLFKEAGFPHVDVCRRISIGRDTGVDVKQPAMTVKRSSGPIGAASGTKKARANPGRYFSWGPREERLVLFLCWRAKVAREKSGEESTSDQVWLDATKQLNQLCKTSFNEQQFQDIYLQLMQSYEQFKQVTDFKGDLETVPKTEQDWDKLIQDRPQFSLQLQSLKRTGGFPHVEMCSRIAGTRNYISSNV